MAMVSFHTCLNPQRSVGQSIKERKMTDKKCSQMCIQVFLPFGSLFRIINPSPWLRVHVLVQIKIIKDNVLQWRELVVRSSDETLCDLDALCMDKQGLITTIVTLPFMRKGSYRSKSPSMQACGLNAQLASCFLCMRGKSTYASSTIYDNPQLVMFG